MESVTQIIGYSQLNPKLIGDIFELPYKDKRIYYYKKKLLDRGFTVEIEHHIYEYGVYKRTIKIRR
jgi:hypothetical protein